MDESRYQQLADRAFATVETLLEDVDADDVDVERAGDVLTLSFKNGKRAVLNTQRPTRQIWLAADARAWHFSFDDASGTWIDDKGLGIELLAQVRAIVKAQAGIDLASS